MKFNIKRNLLLLVTLFAVLSFSNCGKYEDGPGLSLKSKKARLKGTWTLESYDGEAPASGESVTYTFEKGGAYIMTGTSSYGGTTFTFSDAGTWEFTDSKETLSMTSATAGSTANESTILRLTSKELWMHDKDDADKKVTKMKKE